MRKLLKSSTAALMLICMTGDVWAATANSAICRSPIHATALTIASAAAPGGRASDARSPNANANTQLSFVFTYRNAASVMPIAI